MYIQRQQYYQNCNKKHNLKRILDRNESTTHLVVFYCRRTTHSYRMRRTTQHEKIIKNTGKIILKSKCRLTIPDVTIQSREIIFQTETETYLPEGT